MAQYIYERVSTENQSTDSQTHALIAKYPNARIVSETASGMKSRPMLAALVNQLQPGDELIVFGLDRLGRRTAEVLTLLERLEKQGVNFISQREGVDFRTPVGKLVLSILAAVASMEREMLVERTKAGLAAAKAQGRCGGRPQQVSQDALDKALAMVAEGFTVRQAAKEYGLSPSRITYEKLKRSQAAKNINQNAQ